MANEIPKGPSAPNRYDPDPRRSYVLPAHYYYDPEIHEREKKDIFFKSWLFAGYLHELEEPGSYVTKQISDQNVAILRGKDGKLRAFHNVCSHRAHELLSGKGKKKAISCPYHGWAYNLDGSLYSARGCENVEGFDRGEFCLKSVRLETFLNMVFVNLDPKAEPMKDRTADLEKEIREFLPAFDELKFADRCTFDIKANWKNITDNFLECYHCPVAHLAFCQMIDMDTYRSKTYGIWSSHISRSKPPSKKTPYKYSENPEAPVGCFWYLWPNLALNIFPGRANFSVFEFTPTGPERTFETFDMFFRDGRMNEEEKAVVDYFRDVLNPEDFGLVESVQRGLHSLAYHQGRYIVDKDNTEISEHALHHFHTMVLNALGDMPKKSRVAAE